MFSAPSLRELSAKQTEGVICVIVKLPPSKSSILPPPSWREGNIIRNAVPKLFIIHHSLFINTPTNSNLQKNGGVKTPPTFYYLIIYFTTSLKQRRTTEKETNYNMLNFTTSAANTIDTIERSLIRMLIAGPEVSLNGSPTVSPTTAPLCCSLPLPP